MLKGNYHKKLYPEDKFSRKYYCDHARLNQLRADKKQSKKREHTVYKKIQRDMENE
jgi:hypothetical protein